MDAKGIRDTMSIEQNKTIVRNAVAAIGRGDLHGFVAYGSEDFTLTVMAGPTPAPIRGRDNVRVTVESMIRDLLGEGGTIAMTIEHLVAEGEYVVEESRGTSRTKDGRDYNNAYCRVWRIVDGKITACKEYLNTALARAVARGTRASPPVKNSPK
jgi:ketosteroid isomerase-like protein